MNEKKLYWTCVLAALPLGWLIGLSTKSESGGKGRTPLVPEATYSILPLREDSGHSEALEKLVHTDVRERNIADELAFLSSLSDRELAAAYKKAKQEGAEALAKSIEQYWALRDPHGALEFAKWDLDACDHLAYLALAELAQNEPDRWVAAALKLGHKGLVDDRNESFWKDESREGKLKQFRDELTENSLISRTFGDKAKGDVHAAAKEALALEDKRARSEALRGVAKAWATKSPTDALAWAKEIKPDASRLETMRSVLAEWASSDPAECAKHIGDLPRSLASTPVVETLASEWAKTSPEEALAWIQDEATGVAKDRAFQALVEAAADPAEVAQLMAEQGISHPDANEAVMKRWGKADPAAALEWALTSENGEVPAVLRAWAETNPEESLAQYEQLKSEGLLSEQAAEEARIEITRGMSEVAPERALQLLEDGSLDLNNARQTKVATECLSELANDHPDLAAAWVERNQSAIDATAQTRLGWRLMDTLVDGWYQSDPNGAENWIKGLPQSTAKDWAINSMAMNLMGDDREAAFEWASQADDPQARLNIVANMLMDLPRHTGVAETLNNAPFSEEDKERYANLIKSSGHGKTSPWEPEPES